MIKRILGIAKRLMLQIGMDRRTLALIAVAPIAIITLLSIVLNSQATKPAYAVYGVSEKLQAELSKDATLFPAASVAEGKGMVLDRKVDAFLDYSEEPPRILADGADPAITGLVMMKFQKAQQALLQDIPLFKTKMEKMTPALSLAHGNADKTVFDYLAPVMMGFIIFFFIFILAGISFLRERTSGTLERVLCSPARRIELVLGYILGFSLFAVIQTVLIQVFMLYVLGVSASGSFFALLVVNVSLCLVSLSMGGLISAFAKNEFQVFQFIPIVIVPQILFAGMLDLREAPAWVGALSKIFPLTYAGDALRDVMSRGKGLGDIMPQVGIVLGFSVLFIILNTVALRKNAA